MFADIVSDKGDASDILFFIAFLIYVVWIVIAALGAEIPQRVAAVLIPLPLALWVLALLIQ